jgi:hypothetical protein
MQKGDKGCDMTTVSITGEQFWLDGEPTYQGRTYQGRSLEGLLFNSRMIQAIFDDENPQTVMQWAYPDTGQWNAERNTREFCAMLPMYKAHGLLAVTIGLQGGGSNYHPDSYHHYHCSAFAEDGSLKPAYLKRLKQVLDAADDCGMVVIVSYFYASCIKWLRDRAAIDRAIREATEWLLESGHENILVEVINEARDGLAPHFSTDQIAGHLKLVKSITHQGRRLLVGNSAFPDKVIPSQDWLEAEDFTLPHGNNHTPDELRQKLRHWKLLPAIQNRPRPIIINEDSTLIANLDAALLEGVSWGFYHQGYGSDYQYDRFVDWQREPREQSYDLLSGFQTLPVNWQINDPWKGAFFNHLKLVTGGF